MEFWKKDVLVGIDHLSANQLWDANPLLRIHSKAIFECIVWLPKDRIVMAHRFEETTSVISATPNILRMGESQRAETLFENEVAVHLKQHEGVNPSVQALEILIRMEQQISRTIVLRITHPADPFFLFTCAIHEEDFPHIKTEQEIHVDFGSFPHVLIDMISGSLLQPSGVLAWEPNGSQDGVNTSGPHGVPKRDLHFVIEGETNAWFRVKERVNFRDVEFLKLRFVRQGDLKQKEYLAERYKHFQRCFLKAQADGHELDLALKTEKENHLRDVSTLQRVSDELKQKIALNCSEADASQSKIIEQLKDRHNLETTQMRNRHDEERDSLIAKHDAAIETANLARRKSEEAFQAIHKQLESTQESFRAVSIEARDYSAKCKSMDAELSRLREEHTSLTEFRLAALKDKTERDLREVKMQEELKHVTFTLESRQTELGSLRQQYEHQVTYGRRTNDQLEEVQKKLQSSEDSVRKAHYIIGNQLQAMKTEKEKNSTLRERCAALEKAMNEKQLALERASNEITMNEDRGAIYKQQIADLKTQLEASEKSKSKLSEELKSSHDALAHYSRNPVHFSRPISHASGLSLPAPSFQRMSEGPPPVADAAFVLRQVSAGSANTTFSRFPKSENSGPSFSALSTFKTGGARAPLEGTRGDEQSNYFPNT